MQQFYHPQLTPTASSVFLSPEETRHATKVLRLQIGSEIQLLDGKGGIYQGSIVLLKGKQCEVKILQVTQQAPPREKRIHIALAPTKSMDRTEWFVEKAVEIGVDEISFIQTRYSERKVLKLERIEKIAIAAMKQSGNAYLPKINGLTPIKEVIPNIQESDKFIAYVPTPHTQQLATAFAQQATCVFVGPEGGFSEEEVQLAALNGFQSVSLGKSRLRTETAGVAACHTLNLMQQLG